MFFLTPGPEAASTPLVHAWEYHASPPPPQSPRSPIFPYFIQAPSAYSPPPAYSSDCVPSPTRLPPSSTISRSARLHWPRRALHNLLVQARMGAPPRLLFFLPLFVSSSAAMRTLWDHPKYLGVCDAVNEFWCGS